MSDWRTTSKMSRVERLAVVRSGARRNWANVRERHSVGTSGLGSRCASAVPRSLTPTPARRIDLRKKKDVNEVRKKSPASSRTRLHAAHAALAAHANGPSRRGIPRQRFEQSPLRFEPLGERRERFRGPKGGSAEAAGAAEPIPLGRPIQLQPRPRDRA